MSKKRVAFVVPSLCKGGAERVVVNLAKSMMRKFSCEVTIVTFRQGELEYVLPVGVERINLDILPRKTVWGKLYILLLRSLYLKKLFKKNNYEKIYSFTTTANIPCCLTGCSIYVAERNNINYMLALYRKIIARLYNFSNVKRVVAQTDGMFRQLQALGINNVVVIPNPFIPNPASAKCVPSAAYYIVAAGRLHMQKNFTLLIEAYSDSVLPQRGVKLLIAGEGAERDQLEQMISMLGLDSLCQLVGLQDDKQLACLYEHAKFGVMSSNYEGFPNVIIEMLGAGLPVVSTDCAQGPSELIVSGYNGLLVPVGDKYDLTKALDSLVLDESRCMTLQANAVQSIAHLNLDCIAKQWFELS